MGARKHWARHATHYSAELVVFEGVGFEKSAYIRRYIGNTWITNKKAPDFRSEANLLIPKGNLWGG